MNHRVDELGNEARALIEATRHAYEPTASNRAQVLWGVERQLSNGPPRQGLVRRRRVVLAVAAAALVIGGVGVAAAFARRVPPAVPAAPRSAERAAVTKPSAPASPPSAAPRAEVPTAAVPSAATAPTRSVRVAHRAAPARRAGDLSEETRLIARAQAATNRGQGDEALELLKEYDQQFADGALAEERAAARVFALCSTGRQDAARAEAKRFLARWPRSPQAARIRRACPGEAAAP